MKKLLSLFVCFGLLIGMTAVVGCGDEKKPATTTPAKDTPPKDKDKK